MSGRPRLPSPRTIATRSSTPLSTSSLTLPTPSSLDQTHSLTYFGNVILNTKIGTLSWYYHDLWSILLKKSLFWGKQVFCLNNISCWGGGDLEYQKVFHKTFFWGSLFFRWIISYVASQTNHSGYRSHLLFWSTLLITEWYIKYIRYILNIYQSMISLYPDCPQPTSQGSLSQTFTTSTTRLICTKYTSRCNLHQIRHI